MQQDAEHVKTSEISTAAFPLVFNLTNLAETNEYFRRVVETTGNTQTVLMRLESPGMRKEVHSSSDQTLHVTSGALKAILEGAGVYNLGPGDTLTIPKGVPHELKVALGSDAVHLWTVYSPPVHEEGTTQMFNPENWSKEKWQVLDIDDPFIAQPSKNKPPMLKKKRKPRQTPVRKNDVSTKLATKFGGSIDQDLADMLNSML